MRVFNVCWRDPRGQENGTIVADFAIAGLVSQLIDSGCVEIFIEDDTIAAAEALDEAEATTLAIQVPVEWAKFIGG